MVFYLRMVRDQLTQFQERRGVLPEENNFFNLLAVMATQGGQALYAVFTMFLAFLPMATIFIHLVHFVIDRVLDISTTRRQKDYLVKGGIFILQLVVLYFAVSFVMAAIFSPIYRMQCTIVKKMFLSGGGSGCCGWQVNGWFETALPVIVLFYKLSFE